MEREKKYTPRFDCPNTALIYTFHIEALHSMGETAERDRQCDEFISLFDKHSPSPPFFFHILNLVKFFLDNKLYSHAKRFLPYLYCANRFINNNNFGQLISLSSIAIARAEGDTEAYHKFLEEYMNYSVLNYGYVLNNLKLSANLLVEMDEIKEKMQQQQNEIEVAKASSDAKSKFLSNVSHEIRTPLTSIKGFSQTMLNSWDKFDDNKKKIVLYYTGEATKAEVASYTKEKLPRYMFPNVIIQLDEMPYTPNGKVDRVTLKKMYFSE